MLFRVDKLLFFGYLIAKEAVRLLFHGELDSGGCEKRAAFSLSAASCVFFPFLGCCALGRDFFLLGRPSGGSLLMLLEGFSRFLAAEGSYGAVVARILQDHAVGLFS